MASKTQCDEIKFSCGKIHLKSVNTHSIFAKCDNCERKDEDEITLELKGDDKMHGYFVFQCEEAREEINSNFIDYNEAIHAFAELLNKRKKSLSYSE